MLAVAAGAALVLALSLAGAKSAVWDDVWAREKLLESAAAAAADLRVLFEAAAALAADALNAFISPGAGAVSRPPTMIAGSASKGEQLAMGAHAEASARRRAAIGGPFCRVPHAPPLLHAGARRAHALARARHSDPLAITSAATTAGTPLAVPSGAEPMSGLAALLLAAVPALLLAGIAWLAAPGPAKPANRQPPAPRHEAGKGAGSKAAPPRGAAAEEEEAYWRPPAGPGPIGRTMWPAAAPHRLSMEWGDPMYRRGPGASVHPEQAAATFAVACWLNWRGFDLSPFANALVARSDKAADSPDPWQYAALYLYEKHSLYQPLSDLADRLERESDAYGGGSAAVAARPGGAAPRGRGASPRVPKYVIVAGVMLALQMREALLLGAAAHMAPEAGGQQRTVY
jgi:hypothetical protein